LAGPSLACYVSPDARYTAVMSTQLRVVAPLGLDEFFCAAKRY